MIKAKSYPGNGPKRRYLIHYYERLKRDTSKPDAPFIPAGTDADGNNLVKQEHKIDKIEVFDLDESGDTARITVLQEWEIRDLAKEVDAIINQEGTPVDPAEWDC